MKAGIGKRENSAFRQINNKKGIAIAAGIIVVIIVLILIIRALWNPEAREMAKGMDYLEELEAKDVASVEQKVKKVHRASREKAIEEGHLSVWARFGDFVIFGDSRAQGFSYYEFLEEQRVLAERGYTIDDLSEYTKQIQTLNPSVLLLCTGMNDVVTWSTPEAWLKVYGEKVETLKKLLPNTRIYINSVLPAKEEAFEKSKKWEEIPRYNKALQAWCRGKGYFYIDNTEVFEEHQDLYEDDGIHFKKKFYEYWANNILSEVDE